MQLQGYRRVTIERYMTAKKKKITLTSNLFHVNWSMWLDTSEDKLGKPIKNKFAHAAN